MYVNGNCLYRQVTTAVHSKHSVLLLLHYFSDVFPGNIVGQYHEFWTTDTGKWRTLILWTIYQDQKKWTILAGKWHLGTMDRDFLVLDTFLNFCFSVCRGSCVQHYLSQWRQLRTYKSQLSTYTWFFMTWNRIAIFLTKSKASRHNPTIFTQNMCTVGRQWNIKCKNPIHVTLLSWNLKFPSSSFLQ